MHNDKLKRLLDIFLSLFGLIVFFPFFLIAAILVKLDSRGPVFYLCDRVGKDMTVFKMYKFRTMIETKVKVGGSISPKHDPRVTTFGRFLRRTKINELPQLVNILKGDMTFVGPRPEAPDLVELFPVKSRKIFSVRPGLVGPNDLTFFADGITGRNEEELYPPGVDVNKYYIENIHPKKMKIDLEYMENPSLFKDLLYILLGVKETLTGVISKQENRKNRQQSFLLFADGLLSVFSYALAFIIYYMHASIEVNATGFFVFLPAVIIIRFPCYYYFGMYNSLIKYFSHHDVFNIVKGVTFGSLFLFSLAFLFNLDNYSMLITVIDCSCLIILISVQRFALKLHLQNKHKTGYVKKKPRVLIYGAGDTGYMACRSLVSDKNSHFKVVGFVDDDTQKMGKSIFNFKVLGNRYHLHALAQLHKVDEVFLAIPKIRPDEINEIYNICHKAGLKYRIFCSSGNPESIIGHNFSFKAPELSDMLPLKKIRMEHDAVKRIIADKTVLLNGSGEALGLELCDLILETGCRRLIIIDRYESYIADLVSSLLSRHSQELIIPVLISTDETVILEDIFDRYRPDIVFHASTKKHIPFFKVHSHNVSHNNYVRTFNLAKTVSKFNCRFFVMISSLEAGSGGNFISDSLRVAETSLKYFFINTHTRFVAARICDVLENYGGIVSMMEKQIREKETLTYPFAKTQIHLITKNSAAQFILQTLVEALRLTPEKGVFVCDSGPPVDFKEIASKISDLYEIKNRNNIRIKYTFSSQNKGELPLNKMTHFESTHHEHIKVLKENNNNSDKVQSIFKDFLLTINSNSSPRYLENQTRELISLYESSYFISKN